MTTLATEAGAHTEWDARTPVWKGLWLAMAVNCVLMLINIGRDSFWLDEMTSVSLATGSVDSAIGFFKVFPEQLPLYYVTLKGWLLMGTSETTLRSLSALSMLLSTVVIYFLGRETLGEREARVAVCLSAVSPFLIYYGQEGRMYAPLMLLTLLASFLFQRWLRTQDRRVAVMYCLVSIAAVYTHVFAVFAVVAHVAWVAINPSLWTRLKSAVMLASVVAVAFMPWVVFILLHPANPQDWKSWMHVVFGLPYTIFRWTVGYSIVAPNADWKDHVPALLAANAPILICAAIGFGWVAVVGLWKLARFWRRPGGFVLVLLVVPPFLALISSPLVILLSERYLIVSYPAYILLLAAGLVAVVSNRSLVIRSVAPALMAVTIFVALNRYYMSKDFGKAEWREVTQYIAKEHAPADAIMLHDGAIKLVFRHYAVGLPPAVLVGTAGAVDSVRIAPRIWLVVAHAADAGKGILGELAGSHIVARDTLFAKDVGIQLYLLTRRQ